MVLDSDIDWECPGCAAWNVHSSGGPGKKRHGGSRLPWPRARSMLEPVLRRRNRVPDKEGGMYIVREIMYCKPGKIRPLAEKFLAMARLTEKAGMGKMRVMTDVSAERFWTRVAEIEVPTLKAFEDTMVAPTNPEAMKEFEPIMAGYHDLVDHGRREIYKLEG
jgi:hypothetical protein